jgi:hypothetical protein
MRTALPAAWSAVALLLAAAAGPAAADAPPSGPWSWGWRAGAGGTAFTGALRDTADGSYVSFDAGAYAALGSSWLALEPQLIVAARGGNFVDPYFGTFDDGFGNVRVEKIGEVRGSLSSFEARAPIVARLRFAPWPFEPHLLAGVVPALRIYGSYSGNRILRDFWPESFRRADLGWTAGLGTRWAMRHGTLTIDLRYEEGGSDVFRTGRGLPGRMSAWMLGVGLRMQGREKAAPEPGP